MSDVTVQILAILLLSLRIAPTFAYAFPFTLLRIPKTVRILLALSLAIWFISAHPNAQYLSKITNENLLFLAFSELLIGIAFMLSLQWAHAAVLMIGRAVDIQTGFGLALLIDPATRSQRPLIGTLFAYATAAVFFSLNGPMDLLALWQTSIFRLPIGTQIITPDISYLLTYISTVFTIATGLAAVIFLTLFMIDLTVAFLSRTLPQMNVLLIGFQVKTLAVLITLPFALAYSSTLYIRLVRLSIDTIPDLVF